MIPEEIFQEIESSPSQVMGSRGNGCQIIPMYIVTMMTEHRPVMTEHRPMITEHRPEHRPDHKPMMTEHRPVITD